MTKFGILDDDDRVIRWVWDRPGAAYRYVEVKVPRPRKPKIDLSQFEPALF